MALSENEKRRFENRYRGIVDQKSDPFDALPDSVKARLHKRKSTLEKNAGDVPASKRKHIYSEFGTGVETEFRNNLPGLAQEYARKRAESERTLPLIGTGVYGAMTGNNMPSLALEYAQERAAQGYKRPTLRDPEFAAEAVQNAYTGFQIAQRAMQERPSARSTAEEYVSQRKPYSLRQTPYDQDLQKYAPQMAEEKPREKDFRNVGFYDPNNEFVRFDSLERQPDYNDIVAQSKRNGNPLEDYYNNPVNRRLASMGKTDEDIISLTNNFDSATSRTRKYALMSDQERNNYNYIYGKAGKSAAEQYLDALQNTISLRGAAAQYAESKATPSLLRVPANIAKSFESGAKGAIEGFAALPDFLTGTARDYTPKEHEYLQSMLLEDASWPEGLAYKAASAIGNMAPSIATGTIAGKAAGTGSKLAKWAAGGAAQEAVFATQVAGQTYREDIMEGRPVEGAQTNAIFTALDEAATNWLLGGISNLGGGAAKKLLGNTKVAKAAKQGIANAFAKNPALKRAVLGAMNYGGDMLSEGTQEATQDFTEALRKHYIYGDELNLKGVATDPQTWEDFLLGAITAGVMNAPGAIANNVAINQYGKGIDHDYRDVAAGIDTSHESYATAEDLQQAMSLQSLAQEYAARQANKETISNRDKAEFELQLESFNYGAQARKKALDSILAEDQEPPAQQNHESGGERPDAPVQRPTMSQNSPETAQMREASPIAQKVDSVAYNAPTTESADGIVKEYAKIFGKEGQKAFEALYDGETDIAAFSKSFGRAYDIGHYDQKITPEHQREAAVLLGVDGFSTAYAAGARDRNAEIKYDKDTYEPTALIKGAPKEGGLGYVAPSATESQKRWAMSVGKATGLQVDLVDTLENPNAAASYTKGKITLSINSSDFLGSASHELTHYIKDYSPELYQRYKDETIKALMEAKGVDLETLLSNYGAAYERSGQQLSRDELTDEIVADAAQSFFNDPEYINKIVSNNTIVGKKIVDWLTDVIDAIKQLIKTGSTRQAAKALEENLENLETVRDIWMDALERAGDRYKAGWETETKAEPKYKLEKPDQVTDENIEQNYETVRNMEPVAILKGTEFDRGEKNLRDQVMDYYSSVGKVHNDVVGDIYLTKDSVKDDIAHGIGRAKAITFAAIPELLKQGKVLHYNKNWKDRGYDSIILGAPINIEGGKNAGDYYELAIVKVLDDNRLYLHEVYAQKMEANVPFKTPDLKTGNTRSGDTTLPSIYSIFGKLLNVNEAGPENQAGIRFQLEDVDNVDVRALQQENQTLREANDLLKKQLELTSKSKPRQEEVKKVATNYLRKYNSTYNPETLKRNIGGLYEYIRSAEQVDGAEVTELATGIAKSLLKKSRSTSEFADQYQALKRQIKDTKIKITDQDKADLAQMGGYNTFRRQYFGKLTMGNDGISIDSLYQELSSQHPELFPADITHPADQLMAVAAAVDTMTEQIENPYHANLDEMSYIVGQEILMDYFEVRPEPPTFADRKAAEVQKVRREYTKKMNEYKDGIKQKYNQAVKEVWKNSNAEIERMRTAYNNMSEAARSEYKDYYRGRMEDLRDSKNQALAAMQQRYREQLQQRRDSLRSQKAKKGILKERQALETWLLKPTDTKHIPQSLRADVADFLSHIDFSSNELNNNGIDTQRTQAWRKSYDAFKAIIENEGEVKGEDGKVAYMEIDPDMAARMKELIDKVEKVGKLDDLDAYSLEELQKVVISMKKAVSEANSLKSNKKSGEVSILADSVFQDLITMKPKTEYTGVAGRANQLLNYDMLDPQSMFSSMGDSMKSTYDSLRFGLDQKTRLLKSAQDYMENLMKECGITSANIRKWSGRSAEAQTFHVAGGTIELTVPQIMSIYELNKRNQARSHMYDLSGGIKHAPKTIATQIKNGKVILGRIDKQFAPVRVTELDVQNIIKTLTPEQIKFADGLQKFMGDEIAKWGNKVSMEMYGYEKYTAKNYFPIVVDKNYLSTKEGDMINQMSTIKNMGITKSTVEHAHNPIIIEDIFDVFTRQVDQMSSYNAYVIPLSDLNKVWNYRDMRSGKGSIKQEIERTFGQAGNEYIKKLVLDLNGSINQEKSFADKMLSNMKAAAVAGNLRVAIQQPTAYIRASMEIDPKYLLQGAFTISQKGQWEKVCKYSPIAQWKDWGFYRMDTSRQLKDIMMGTDGAVKRFVNVTMIGAELGDKIAWNRLWSACEYECRDKFPDLKPNTEEFYKKVGERFGEIIDKTQVVDSTLHRTQIMRKNGLDKLATNFMAEPLKTFDMLYRASIDVRNNRPGAKARAARAAAVFVATNVVTALAASVIDAMRDDDREKPWTQKYKESVLGNLKDNMNILNNIPYVRDAISTFAGFTPARADATAYQDLYYAYLKIRKLYEGDSSLTPQYVASYTIQMSSKLLGVPIRTISRDAGAIIDTARNIAGGEADYKWLRQKYDIGHDDNRKMYAKMILEAEEAGNTSLADTIRADMVAAGADSEKINSAIDGIVKKRYEDDDRIQQAAQARIDGKPEEYKRIYEEILADPTYESQYPEQVQKLIKSAQGKLKEAKKNADIGDEGEEEEKAEDQGETYTSIYTNADMINALVAGNKEGFALVAEDIYKSKIAAGKKPKEALSDIRKEITKVYKKKYKEAKTREEKDNIIKLMNTLRVAGQNIYSGYDYSSWRK